MAADSPVVLVTGSTDGIGRHTAVELARRGHTVLVHGRRTDRVEAALATARKEVPGAVLHGVVGDLSSVKGARDLAQVVLKVAPRLDVLLNNAGVFMNTFERGLDGVEMTFAVNHLGHFALTHDLLPALLASPLPRVINVSSMAHGSGRWTPQVIRNADAFDGYGAYAFSKLCNVLFTVELARRIPASRLVTHALHPGVVTTKLLRTGFGSSGPDSLEAGSRTSVFLATDAGVVSTSGEYFSRSARAQMNPQARVPKNGAALWEDSEKLCGFTWNTAA